MATSILKVDIRLEVENDAFFEDGDFSPRDEIVNILHKLADDVADDHTDMRTFDLAHSLKDYNGNRVGQAKIYHYDAEGDEQRTRKGALAAYGETDEA